LGSLANEEGDYRMTIDHDHCGLTSIFMERVHSDHIVASDQVGSPITPNEFFGLSDGDRRHEELNDENGYYAHDDLQLI
jgi:hypothetical protein